jgi:hypothetical protein
MAVTGSATHARGCDAAVRAAPGARQYGGNSKLPNGTVMYDGYANPSDCT